MNEDKWLRWMFIFLIATIGGCCIMQNKYKASVMIEQEKTKQMQMQLQAKIDSLQITHIKEYGKRK